MYNWLRVCNSKLFASSSTRHNSQFTIGCALIINSSLFTLHSSLFTFPSSLFPLPFYNVVNVVAKYVSCRC